MSPPTLLIDNQLDTVCYLVVDIRVLIWAVAQLVEHLIIVIVLRPVQVIKQGAAARMILQELGY